MRFLGHFLGFVFGCSGLAFGGWVVYNLFVEETAAFSNIFSDSNLAGASALAGLIMAIVGFKLMIGGSRDDVVEAPRQALEISPDVLARVQAAALEGRVIEAVKLYREATGAGLRDAKQAVDQMRQWAH